MGIPSVGQLAVIAVIVLLLFGSRKLKNLGSDLGGGLKGLRDGFKDADAPELVEMFDEKTKAVADAAKQSLEEDIKQVGQELRRKS